MVGICFLVNKYVPYLPRGYLTYMTFNKSHFIVSEWFFKLQMLMGS